MSLISDLRLPDGSFAMWKFADDTTVSEIVPPSKQSVLQQAVDFTSTWSQDNRLQRNPSKCEELQSCFKSSPPTHSPVELDGFVFERVSSAKVLGVTVRDSFKWNDRIFSATSKAAKRLYLLRQLQRVGFCASDLVLFYCSTIRSVLEYTLAFRPIYLRSWKVFRSTPSVLFFLTQATTAHPSLYDRRASLWFNLFDDIVLNTNQKLASLLPPKADHHRQLRSNRKFNVPGAKRSALKNLLLLAIA